MIAIRLALAVLLCCPYSSAAQDALDAVRDLYASAEYEEALSALSELKSDSSNGGLVEIDRYRVLCLIALGRSQEADHVIEAIVTGDPLYQPGAADAAPRVRTAFSDVRRRVLPGVVRSLYARAKEAFDRKAFPEAVEALEQTVRVIDSMDEADNSSLGDLRLLASGFLDLSRASLRPDPVPAVSAVDRPADAQVTRAVPVTPTIPVAIRQDVPGLPFALARATGEFRGAIEVEISATGEVVGAQIVESIHSLYDPLLLRAARDWKYEPGRIGATPIQVRKRVDILLRP